MSSPAGVDVVVVGAGVIGLSIAFEAGRRGRKALVLDEGGPASGATGVAAGMLAPVAEIGHGAADELTRLGIDSLRRYAGFVAEVEALSGLGCGYDPQGSVHVALHRDHMARLEHEVARAAELGLTCERLRGSEVQALEPRLRRCVGGVRMAGDHQVDPRRLSRALVDAIAIQGGRVWSPARALSAQRQGGEHELTVSRAGAEPVVVRAAAVIVAAGARSAGAVPGLELPPLPLRPVKGQLVRLRSAERVLSRVVRTPDVYLVPRSTGELLIGASSEERGFDDQPTAGVVMDLLTDAFRALPCIYDLPLTEVCVGFRPALRDGLPAIGATGSPGVFVATGHFRNGILLAPATAAYLLDVVSGAVPGALHPFDPRRFEAAPSSGHYEENPPRC